MSNKHDHVARVKEQLSEKRHFRRSLHNLIRDITMNPEILDDPDFAMQNFGWETLNYK
jgi:hypothetical protein